MRAIVAFLACVFAVALPASAVDLATNAVVDIVLGITITQTTSLNFGVLVLDNGVVTVSPVDGTYTDADNLIFDATDINQGVFDVATNPGVDITVICTAGALPPGLIMGSFTADWANGGAPGPVPRPRTTAAATEVLEIGASLAIDRTVATPTGGTPALLPYTVSVTFQ
ncbi:MAG TPA: hypothetical protein PLL30_02630 [Candidatus Krumholzibacteria bacterium]|nr:hypothetical protein [Candidatus Krumholzibacteria bacterium]HPD70665.1 hypothetical protein [Candidatus Krumholzibacteria bacterium]HRY39635.1 hypothetical protein [Candidatus Krumholzibacteria bacterium]